MEYLEVKKFGPIKHAKVELKKFNVFIGETSSGKSTMAKLVSAIYDRDFTREPNSDNFKEIIEKYGILSYLRTETEIYYIGIDFKITFLNGRVGFGYMEKSSPGVRSEIYGSKTLISSIKTNKPILESVISDIISDIENESIGSFREELKELLENDKVKTGEEIYMGWLKIAKSYSSEVELFPSIYIPAERMVISMVAESLFGLMNNDVTIAKCVKDFGAHFEVARKKVQSVDFQWLGASYQYEHKSNFVKQEEQSFKLEESSSGFQSIIPTLVVLEHYASHANKENNLFVIEEPELNLYPSMQKKFVEHIVQKLQQTEDKIILTTHSPYVLTSLDNLIQAQQASQAQPEKKAAVQALVPENYWVNYDDVACYYFKDGTCVSTLDPENKSIGPSNIDDVSEELGQVFEQLLDIKYS